VGFVTWQYQEDWVDRTAGPSDLMSEPFQIGLDRMMDFEKRTLPTHDFVDFQVTSSYW
jgi:hypothetical protein